MHLSPFSLRAKLDFSPILSVEPSKIGQNRTIFHFSLSYTSTEMRTKTAQFLGDIFIENYVIILKDIFMKKILRNNFTVQVK